MPIADLTHALEVSWQWNRGSLRRSAAGRASRRRPSPHLPLGCARPSCRRTRAGRRSQEERGRSPFGTWHAPATSGSKSRRIAWPVTESASRVVPVVRVFTCNDLRSRRFATLTAKAAGELQRRVNRFRDAGGEEDPIEVARCKRGDALGQLDWQRMSKCPRLVKAGAAAPALERHRRVRCVRGRRSRRAARPGRRGITAIRVKHITPVPTLDDAKLPWVDAG